MNWWCWMVGFRDLKGNPVERDEVPVDPKVLEGRAVVADAIKRVQAAGGAASVTPTQHVRGEAAEVVESGGIGASRISSPPWAAPASAAAPLPSDVEAGLVAIETAVAGLRRRVQLDYDRIAKINATMDALKALE
jgi:hypothetical protein